jgi:cardiolipin synthase
MNISSYFRQGKIWTLSNILSLSRLVIGLMLFYYIYTCHTYLAILLALLAVFTDFADGYVARLRNEITELGKILDPVADKIAVALGAIALYKSYGLPLWVVVVIIGRDVLILIGSILLIEKVKGVVPSRMPGKIAVTVISMLLLSYLFEWHAAKNTLIVLTILAIIYSFISYLIIFIKYMLKSKREPERNGS